MPHTKPQSAAATTTHQGQFHADSGLDCADDARQLFELSPAAHLILDASDGSLLDANFAARKILALDEECVRDSSAKSLGIQAVLENHPDHLIPFRGTNGTTSQAEICRRDGTAIKCDISSTTTRWNGRRVIVAVLVPIESANGISERTLTKQKWLSEAALPTALGELAGNVAHEFNNLLTTILGNASLARLDIDESSPFFRALSHIERAATQAAQLCLHLSTFSAAEPFSIQTVDLRGMILDVTQFARLTAAKRVDLIIDVPNRLPFVDGDVCQLRAALLLLMLHGVHSLPSGRGKLQIAARSRRIDASTSAEFGDTTRPVDGEYISIEMRAPGIQSNLRWPARPEVPLNSSAPVEHHLRLLEIDAIARNHGGLLSVDQSSSEGMKTTLLLPIETTATQRETKPAIRSDRKATAGPHTVLLVDDDDQIRSAIRRMLEACGLCVIEAVNGIEGLEQFRRHAPQINAVLLDSNMPEMNGMDVVRGIRTITSEVPILLMSGFNQITDENQTRCSKGVDFLQKPFTPTSLESELSRIFGAPVSLTSPSCV
ncbi:MAG: response regulator [Pedosphaera sp.]|nr:response regulator [Pedosphaera sp.]